jgi:hypothetical protein
MVAYLRRGLCRASHIAASGSAPAPNQVLGLDFVADKKAI